jgi:hypothetical protein
MAVTVYNRHKVAALVLPAVTVGGESTTNLLEDIAFRVSDEYVNHVVIISVRVHTGYLGWKSDRSETVQIVDEIIDIVKKNINIDSSYRLMDFEVESYNQEFEESQSVGAEVKLEYHIIKDYTQA